MEMTRQQKSIAITAPKGYSKVQAIIQEKDPKIEKFAEEMQKKEAEDEEANKMEKTEKPEKPEKLEKTDNKEDEKFKLQNGAHPTPPKPLPRASRANSLSEEEPKPVARPRTTPSPGSVVTSVNPNIVGGYKVRLRIQFFLFKFLRV